MSLGQLRLLKQILRAGDGSASLALEDLRANFEDFLGRFPGVEGLEVTRGSMAGVAVEWLDFPELSGSAEAAAGESLLVYLHGGGFVVGSAKSHRHTAARLARAAGTRCLMVDYRLAPEYPYPAALEDVMAVWRYLLAEEVPIRRLVLAGDSAGGGLAVLAMVMMRREGLALPTAAVAFSPWVDYAGTTPSLDSHADLDPVVQRPGLEKMAKLFLGDADPWHADVTALRADLRGLPPLLIQAGGSETLLDDAKRLEAHARRAGMTVELEIWPEMIHVWHLFAARLEEGKDALEAAGKFLEPYVTGRNV